jgi:predicted DNA-binding transcriptional regulator AlpA
MVYLGAAEVSARYCICVRTIYRLMKRGAFPQPIKIGGQNRWPEPALLEWEAAQHAKA